ncbi:MAG: DUF2169 domain-containing protein [Myxococcota bacterium]
MWGLDNRTPFAALGRIVIDENGSKHWLVTVKGAFKVGLGGTVEVADDQPEPLLLPEYRGDDGESSLVYEADAIPLRPRVDVLVNGRAFAPEGKPTTQVNVTLNTPFFRKTIEVTGDRVFKSSVLGVTPSRPMPFVEIPLVYERAYGGFDQTDPDPAKQRMDPRNPVGCGLATKAAHLVGKPVPNLAYPGGRFEATGPAGFGPICSYWEPRRSYAGTYNARWVEQRKPLLPADFDHRFYNTAPLEQQIEGRYRGGGRIDTINMSPQGPFGFEVPKIALGFSTHFSSLFSPEVEHHHGELKAIVLEPHEGRFFLLWQTSLACHVRIDDVDFTVIRQKRWV